MNLRVAFNAIPVRQETVLRSADFFIGCCSAEIQMTADQCTFQSYTAAVHLTVAYKASETHTRSSRVVVQPHVSVKSPYGKVEAGVGEICFEAGRESTFETSFSSEERILAPLLVGSTIKWRFDPPNVLNAVRDFLFGNLYLFAVCNYHGDICGSISVRPSDITFFDPSRRPYGRKRSILMLCKLWIARRKVFCVRGITLQFREATL